MSNTNDRSPSPRPLILVTGATGAQGGSVARHLLRRGRFAVRALTRDPGSARALQLRALGAEVLRGDLADPVGLRRAMRGAAGVFGVTNYWEHFAGERAHGLALADAVREAEVAHFVFSTLPSVRAETGGELQVEHFDLKAEMEAYARGLELPATCVHIAYYYDNFLSFFAPQRQGDGSWLLALPQGDTPLAGIAVDDVGGIVATIFERREAMLGRTLFLAGDERTADDYVTEMARATHRPIRYAHLDREAFAALGFPGARDIADMFDYYRRFVPSRRDAIVGSQLLYPALQGFGAWVRANAATLRASLDAQPVPLPVAALAG